MHTVVFDLNGLLDRVDGDREFARELLEIFLKDTEGRIDALVNALSKADLMTAHGEAHTLKGAAANAGANELCRIALALESACQRGENPAALGPLDMLKPCFQDTKAVILAWINGAH